MAFVKPVKHVGNEHRMLELGDTIDPQFLPPISLDSPITVAAELIPKLTPGSGWVSYYENANKQLVIGFRQIVIHYNIICTITNSGLTLALPVEMRDDQGRLYRAASGGFTGHDAASLYLTPAYPVLPFSFVVSPFSVAISAAVGPGMYRVYGHACYIRE
jgi:hypothetical protein